jgi:chemotaxis protein CheX
MDVRFLNPFISAAYNVLSEEAGITAERKEIKVDKFYYTSEEITVLIGVTGAVRGLVLYGLSQSTAIRLVSTILGKKIPYFDSLVESGIAEIGNVIAGGAMSKLEANGYLCHISPPTVLLGKGVIISTVNIEGIMVPLETEFGSIKIVIALREEVVQQ